MLVAPSTQEGDLVTPPAVGMVAGAFGALAMLAVVAMTRGMPTVQAWLDQLGGAPLGIGLHLVVGGLLGALHAACQQRTVVGGLFAVGIFYGFLIWLIAGLVVVRWWNLSSPLSTWWPGLPANLVFGLVLATCAAAAQKRSAAMPGHAIPVD